MIYLFNSAYRTIYVRNVLNTLFVPRGSTNEYRYRVSGDVVNIDPSSRPQLESTPSNEPIAVVFIDRSGSSAGYVYHPLRLGRFVACEEKTARLHFTVRLDDYICPVNLAAFNERICETLGTHGLPQLTNGDPFNDNDGYYAITADSIFDDHTRFYSGDRAWKETVERLSAVPAFAPLAPRREPSTAEDDHHREFLFLKCTLLSEPRGDRALTPELVENQYVFTLTRASEYGLRLTYYYPPQQQDTSLEAAITVTHGENLGLLRDSSLHVDALGNTVDVPLRTKRHAEDREGAISFDFKPSRPDHTLIGPDRNLRFRIAEPASLWVKLLLAFALYALVAAITGADLTGLHPLLAYSGSHFFVTKLVPGFVQALILFYLFRELGHKFM